MSFIQPVAEALLHPPLGFLQRELITGTFSGSGDLTRPDAVLPPFNNVNAYGLTWSFVTVPAGFGFTLGFPNVYEERMIQLAATYVDHASHELIGEYHSFFVEGIYWLWDQPGPQRIHYEIVPGVSVTFYWLILRP